MRGGRELQGCMDGVRGVDLKRKHTTSVDEARCERMVERGCAAGTRCAAQKSCCALRPVLVRSSAAPPASASPAPCAPPPPPPTRSVSPLTWATGEGCGAATLTETRCKTAAHCSPGRTAGRVGRWRRVEEREWKAAQLTYARCGGDPAADDTPADPSLSASASVNCASIARLDSHTQLRSRRCHGRAQRVRAASAVRAARLETTMHSGCEMLSPSLALRSLLHSLLLLLAAFVRGHLGTGPLPLADRKAQARKPGLEILEVKVRDDTPQQRRQQRPCGCCHDAAQLPLIPRSLWDSCCSTG